MKNNNKKTINLCNLYRDRSLSCFVSGFRIKLHRHLSLPGISSHIRMRGHYFFAVSFVGIILCHFCLLFIKSYTKL